VLRSTDYGETNKIVTLLTSKYGKMAVLAKGANKPKSRLAAVAQPFCHGDWLFYGGTSGMPSVSQADVVSSFRGIREDIYQSAYAACMAELTDRILVDREPYTGVFPLLLHVFQALNDGKDGEVLLRLFEMKMLYAAGIQPDLDHCANCGRQISDSVRFSVRYAGALCPDCHDADAYAVWMKPAAFKLLKLFQKIDPSRLGTINVHEDVKQQLDKITRQYLEEHGGFYLKSRRFLDQLDKYQL
jgi:DNA repair protein RecO (recombination protein O)